MSLRMIGESRENGEVVEARGEGSKKIAHLQEEDGLRAEAHIEAEESCQMIRRVPKILWIIALMNRRPLRKH